MTAGPQWLKSGLQVLGLGSGLWRRMVATDQTINLCGDVAEKYVAIICCMVSI